MTDRLARLGKHKVSKACLVVNKPSDIDLVLPERRVWISFARMEAAYPPRLPPLPTHPDAGRGVVASAVGLLGGVPGTTTRKSDPG